MKIKIYAHTTPAFANTVDDKRICVALLNDKDEFQDSFDYNIHDNTIRFYGSSKHYNFDKIPKIKQKLWKTSDFSTLLFKTYIL